MTALHPAEQRLVAADPALPGLRLLLDTDRLSEWIGSLLGRPLYVRRRNLRYKPGTSCVMHVDAGGTPLLVSAQTPNGHVKHDKTRDRAGNAVLGVDSGLGVLVGTPPSDRDLPGIAALTDPDSPTPMAERLLAPGRSPLPCAAPTLLRYKPHRRWVALLPTESGENVLLRAYRRESAGQAAHALRVLSGGEPPTPGLLGQERGYGVLATEFLPGTPAHDAPAPTFERVGAALAALHRNHATELSERPLLTESRAARDTACHLGQLLPELAERADTLAQRIADTFGELSELRVPIHGDFSADQAVISAQGRIGLIDLDNACLGDPAMDLGCAAAALTRDLVLDEIERSEHDSRMAALRRGYDASGGPATTDRIPAHTAAHLLRRTVEPFRLGLGNDWQVAAHALLSRAEAALAEPATNEGR